MGAPGVGVLQCPIQDRAIANRLPTDNETNPPMSSSETPSLVWGHININVRDLERSIEFYEKLGFEMFMPAIPYLGLSRASEVAPIPSESARALGLAPGTRGRACIMQLGKGFPKIDLTELAIDPTVDADADAHAQSEPLTSGDLGLVRLCLASSDLASDHARLAGRGVEFLSAPEHAKDGLAEIATCVDPDGTLIELIQIHLDKWPRPPSGG